MMRFPRWRQALAFVAVSGIGWLLDVGVFMTLSGPAGWHPVAANVVSGSCGALFVFLVSASRIFRRNQGTLAQKVVVLLVFNLAVIVASSFLLGLIAAELATASQRLGWALPAADIRLAAKIIVTPATLLLNFLVVRFLVERFIGLRAGAVPALRGRRPA